jgi:hypothetical protein
VVSISISTKYWPVAFRGRVLGVRLVREVVEQLATISGSTNSSNDLEMFLVMGVQRYITFRPL